MGDLLTDIASWMASISPFWAYATILAIAYGENVLPPVPGDMVVVFGGYLVGMGRLDFWAVVLLATVGGAVGFMTMYGVGHRIGEAVLDPHRLRWLPKRHVVRAERWIRRWGYGVVLANRFLSGLRSVISLTVGVAQMDPWKTLGFATLSAFAWTLLIAYAGFKVGTNWHVVSVYLNRYGLVVLGLLAVFGIVRGLQLYRHRRRG